MVACLLVRRPRRTAARPCRAAGSAIDGNRELRPAGCCAPCRNAAWPGAGGLSSRRQPLRAGLRGALPRRPDAWAAGAPRPLRAPPRLPRRRGCGPPCASSASSPWPAAALMATPPRVRSSVLHLVRGDRGPPCSTPSGAASRSSPSELEDLLHRLHLLVARRVATRPPRAAAGSASSSSSSVARKASTRSLGRSRMKPTVSVMMTSRSSGKRRRRLVGSSVAKSLFSASTSRVGERVEQRGLARVGVAHDGDDRQLAPVALAAAHLALAARCASMRFSRWVMRSRTRRRSISSFVSPGPRPPMPPASRRERVVALGQPGQAGTSAGPARPGACRRRSARAGRRCRG